MPEYRAYLIGLEGHFIRFVSKLLAALDQAEDYRGLTIRASDRGERDVYERIVELYVEIAEQLEALIDSLNSPR